MVASLLSGRYVNEKSLFAMAMIAMAGSAMAQTTHPGAAGHDMKPQIIPADATTKMDAE